MADTHIPIDPSSPALIPLLISTHEEQQHQQGNLDRVLRKLEAFLLLLGFHQSSVLSFSLSWIAFVLVGVLLPVTIFEVSNCAGCDKFQIKKFELDIVASQACLAAAALVCISYNLRKYGIRRFLFVDKSSGQHAHLSQQYIQQIKVSTVVQVVGITICLHAATKISHRAQGIASLASKWHALATCSAPDASQARVSNNTGNMEAVNGQNSLRINYSESDLESMDCFTLHTSTQLASHVCSYHRRQAFAKSVPWQYSTSKNELSCLRHQVSTFFDLWFGLE